MTNYCMANGHGGSICGAAKAPTALAWRFVDCPGCLAQQPRKIEWTAANYAQQIVDEAFRKGFDIRGNQRVLEAMLKGAEVRALSPSTH